MRRAKICRHHNIAGAYLGFPHDRHKDCSAREIGHFPDGRGDGRSGLVSDITRWHGGVASATIGATLRRHALTGRLGSQTKVRVPSSAGGLIDARTGIAECITTLTAES